MVKTRWHGRIAGVVEPSGGRGSVVMPVKVVEEPGRFLDVPIPLNRVPALIKQLAQAAQRERTLVAWAKGGIVES